MAAALQLYCLLLCASTAFSMMLRTLSESEMDRYNSRLGGSASVVLKRRAVPEMVKLFGEKVATHKAAYFGEITVGSPAQKFTVAYDTGSGNLIIPAEICSDHACNKHNRFTMGHSSSAKQVHCDGRQSDGSDDGYIKITYGSGHVSGQCINDKICMGDVCTSATFVYAISESNSPFDYFAFDGVLGLGRDTMAHGQRFSLLSRLVGAKLLAEPLFSVFLSDSGAETSEISFGQIKKEHMASELFWMPVSRSTGYWEVQMEDVTLDGKRQQLCESCHVVVDTGVSQLGGPSEVMDKLQELLNISEDCANYDQLPKLGFIMGTHILNLEPKDYVTKTESNGCQVGMSSLDVPPPKGPLFLFGIPFLQKYYTVFDHANSRVGFAVAKHAGQEPIALMQVNAHVTNLGAAHEHQDEVTHRLRSVHAI